MTQQFIPKLEFDRVRKSFTNSFESLPLLSMMCRLNTFFEVKRAGSGHLGTSFSAMDIACFMYFHHLNLRDVGFDSPNRDIYFSSKGHDVPGQYAVLYALGVVPEERFLKLRRLGGLDGHPDIRVPGIEANTGSLGMGISKARGIATAKKIKNWDGRVFVMTGDGEWQEGQNFEALQSTVQQKVSNVTVLMDHNKLQSDRLIDRIVSLGDLEKKFAAFGWAVFRCDGHNYSALKECVEKAEKVSDRPKIIICDTIKGSGISFMEHPQALKDNNGYYKWHSGAPDDESFQRGWTELLDKVKSLYKKHNLGELVLKSVEPHAKPVSQMSSEFLAVSYGRALVEQAEKNKDFVVLDADLSLDCKLRDFEDKYPARFFEMGIAEQDMVSMAGGLALQGITPVVNSFANFLAARANEQIYNNLSEGRKIIYACHYAGLLPAGPGKSHQSVRDISLFGAFPNCTIVHPASSEEVRQVVDYALNEAKESCMLRFPIGPSPQIIELPATYKLKLGQGSEIRNGKDALLFAYGPVMLNEALQAHDLLKAQGLALRVVNMPWINRFDSSWLESQLQGFKTLFVLEDHSTYGGLGDHLSNFMNLKFNTPNKIQLTKFGVEAFPVCGTPWEALKHHGLDAESIARKILETHRGREKA